MVLILPSPWGSAELGLRFPGKKLLSFSVVEKSQWNPFTGTSSNERSYRDKETAHPAIYSTSFNAQASLSLEQGILLLATNPVSEAPSCTAEMCLARAENSPAQPLLREAILTVWAHLVWLSSALRFWAQRSDFELLLLRVTVFPLQPCDHRKRDG